MTAYDGHTITYSGGNPTNWYNGETYSSLSWVQGRRLSSLTKGTSNSATSISYDYDMSGIRSSKTVDGVTHSYVTQSGKVVRETYGTVTLEFFYDANGRPFALEYADSDSTNTNTGKFYYVLNAQGDVVGLLNESGTLVVKYTYDAWGKLLSVTDASGTEIVDEDHIANINPLRYRGYYYDADTGWYYLQSRYYDPIVKRFLNADTYESTGQDFLGCNMFAYCGNNPTNAFDETGTLFNIVDRFASAAVSFVCTLVTGNGLEEALINASVGFAVGFVGGQVGRIVGAVYSGLRVWLKGGNLWDVLVGMGLSYMASYISGSDLLGDSAQGLEKLLVALPFGTGANLVSELLSLILSYGTSSTQANNLQDNAPIPYCSNALAGGGGGKWNCEAFT